LATAAGVHHHDADHARLGRLQGVNGKPPAVVAIVQGDGRNAHASGSINGHAHCLMSGHLAKRLLPVQNGPGNAFAEERRPRSGIKFAVLDSVAVLTQPQNAMRIVANKV
jgi:hypothetical protein